MAGTPNRTPSNPLLVGLDREKVRAKSEPTSTHAWQAVLFGRHSGGGGGGGHGGHAAPQPVITASSLVMTADETYEFTAATGQHKYSYPLPKLFVLGMLAGAYIGLGYSLCCLVGGLLSPEFRKTQPGVFNLLFGVYGFPMGLTLCVVAGGDLFTSNCMYSTVGWWEGRFGLYGWLRMLLVSYFSNLLGALLLVGLMKGGDVFHSGRGDFLMELAEHKVAYGWGAVLLRGVLGNWLVCLAVWQGNMARDFAGKAIGVWLPDAAFVSMGLEHCIANMFLVPMAMSLGAPITAAQFIRRNLIPATLGNLIGGATLVASAYACSLGSPGHTLQDAWEDGLQRAAAAWRNGHAAATNPTLSPRSNSFGHVPSKPAPAGMPDNGFTIEAVGADGGSTHTNPALNGTSSGASATDLDVSSSSAGAGTEAPSDTVLPPVSLQLSAAGGFASGPFASGPSPSPRRRPNVGFAAQP